MATFAHAGCDVAFRVDDPTPGAQTLLLISGLGGTMAFWNTVWPLLTGRYRLIAFDHPGMGDSAEPLEPPSVASLANLSIALLDHLGVNQAVFVGHSMGGAIAQSVAIDQPERVRALVLSSTWAVADHYFRKAFAQRKMLLEKCGRTAYARAQTLSAMPPEWIAANPQLADAQEQRATASFRDPAVVGQRIDAVVAFDRTADLSAIRCETLVIHCNNDAVVPQHMSIDLARRLTGARLLEIAGGGHFSPVVNPQAFADGLIHFIDHLNPL